MKRMTSIFICVTSVVAGACHPARDTAPGETRDAMALSIMSFNIRYGAAEDGENHWNNRREAVFDVVRTYEPDVMGVQEALRFQLDELRHAVPEYDEIGVGRDDGAAGGEYSAILYRAARFTVAEQGTFWLSDTPHVPGSMSWGNRLPRICTWGHLIDKASGRDFYVYNVHLDHESQPSRERAVKLLLERISQRSHDCPVIVTGDFNADEENPAIRRMLTTPITSSRSTMALVDTFRVLHPDKTDVQTFNGFGSMPDRGKIDYVFAPRSAQVLSATIIRDHRDGRFPSDHFPVDAKLRLPSGGR